jgi:hypothetical protein
MYLVQILLPTHDNDGNPFDGQTRAAIHGDLVEKFGGLTAYSRAPAEGTWAVAGSSSLDDIVVVEVMAETLETEWWKAFRSSLEQTLRQHRIVVRAHRIEVI